MKEKDALRLTILLAFLVFTATLLGTAYNSLYADGDWYRVQYFGQDLFTMLIVIPFLVIGAQQGLNNNVTAWRLIFMAALLYLIYVYAIYVFAAEFSPLYFVQLPVFSLSLFILLSLMGGFFISRRKIIMPGRTLRALAAAYLLFTAVMLSVLWLNDLLQHTFVPGHRSMSPDGKPLLIIYSLDLGVIVPLILMATIGLLRSNTRGIAWTGIMLTLSTLMSFALMAMSISAYYSGVQSDPFFIALWTILGMAGLVITILYMNRLQDALPENS
ncbi:MAG TPA: hypothetical protein P5248_05160 [Bacteroidales bacterium]|nr:hypothetical protein [Bacteroidales bacterium]